MTRFDYDGVEVRVAGTGYTGEEGLEIAVPNEAAEEIFRSLVDAEITPAGLGARDTLRLEAALPLYGHELTAVLDDARGAPRLGPRLGQGDVPRSRGRRSANESAGSRDC